MNAYEKLGFFYLGKKTASALSPGQEEVLLYPSAALRTHALCVGMTGSGKTGLGINILEEAAIDGIPALVIDPKGDMANLCLSFPEMRPEDFTTWIDESELRLKNLSREAYAENLAAKWRRGLQDWEQSPERIRLLRDNADITVYTPGSNAGEPISYLDSLAAPSPELLQDFNSLNEIIASTTAALLQLIGISADPLQSRETILLSNILQTAWHRGENLTLAALIGYIQNPPSESVGVLDWQNFYPQEERRDLALRFNSLLASPAFAKFLIGRPLDIDSLLYNDEAKAKISIISIAHLNEDERMFFVAMLLNKLLAWTRAQSGSQSLRALLYMDEIFGYFPPVANPPSKRPLLTLLKQARAYGLGLILATQNPVDLDYKGLSNIGTWWIGRLQTENDRKRLLDGLQAAHDTQGQPLSRSELAEVISSLEPREFLMHNVRSNELSIFTSRHCLSYLKGPMTLADIGVLKEQRLYDPDNFQPTTIAGSSPLNLDPHLAADLGLKESVAASKMRQQRQEAEASAQALQATSSENLAVETLVPVQSPGGAVAPGSFATSTKAGLQLLPEEVSAYFSPAPAGANYYPRLAGLCESYIRDKKNNESFTLQELRVTDFIDGPIPVRWEESEVSPLALEDLQGQPSPQTRLSSLPAAARDKKSYRRWEQSLVDYIYREQAFVRYESPYFKLQSRAGESERDFKIRVKRESREEREEELSKLRDKYSQKLASQAEKVRKAEQSLEQKEEMQSDAKRQTVISVGSSILNAVLGKKAFSSGTLGRATTASRSASRAGRLGSDVERAADSLSTYQEAYQELEEEMAEALAALEEKLDAQTEEIREIRLTPLKRDVKVKLLFILWQTA